MPEGQIIRAVSSFYYVETEKKTWECKARGIFKKRKITPLVGDYVKFEEVDENHGYIYEISPRKNELIRPQISNVDQAILVFSAKEPDFSPALLDKFLVHVEKAGINPIICVTKTDLMDEHDESIDDILDSYKGIGYSVIKTNKASLGIGELKEKLNGKTSVFAGQSGVGKSTLLNTLNPSLKLETANISKRLGRGKHTTRVVQLIHLTEGGLVADTPGFSQLDFTGIDSGELGQYFVELNEISDQCKFRGCVHQNEPDCAVKLAVSEDKISPIRYQHYLGFLKEIKEIEEKKWR